ncbi:hypothetical protein KUTeg_006480 [Tegillarca granosa]|uniref:Uncharacterized protein n=1 Tax=Tegillarca granosa TaxID=220873 RepID=A0ABQ9FJX1_TEGGR|nr:hypothetical protein KUTeg_006480 [Tegillarca granosa]
MSKETFSISKPGCGILMYTGQLYGGAFSLPGISVLLVLDRDPSQRTHFLWSAFFGIQNMEEEVKQFCNNASDILKTAQKLNEGSVLHYSQNLLKAKFV